MTSHPPLKPLHSDETLSTAKLAIFEKQTTYTIKASLVPRQQHCLKARPDGTMLDGHHRVCVLRPRNEDINLLPREIIQPGT
jgi:hypothetical protein